MVTEIIRHHPTETGPQGMGELGEFLARVEEVWVFEPINFSL